MTELATRPNGHNRRAILKRGLVLAAGALGVAVAGKEAKAATTRVPNQLRLHGTQLASRRFPTVSRGTCSSSAITVPCTATCSMRPNGTPLGQFYGSRLAIQSVPGGHARADASVEVHTFVLPDGTIIGMGTAVLGEAIFAIVGGTGVYAGAKGSYSATQRLREHGGNGTADFVLTLKSLEE